MKVLVPGRLLRARLQRVRLLRVLGAGLVLALVLTTVGLVPVEAASNPPAPVRIMPLGDSITVGLNQNGDHTYRYFLWHQLVNAGYAVDFAGSRNGTINGRPAIIPDFDMDHEGRSGREAGEAAANAYAWGLADQPDIALIHLGTNDILQGQSNATTTTELRTTIDQLRLAKPKVTVLIAQIIPTLSLTGQPLDAQVQDLNSRIATMAAAANTAQSPVIVVDQYSGFSRDTDTYDGTHPNASGDQKLSNKWYDTLTQVLGPPDTTPAPDPAPGTIATVRGTWHGWGIARDASNNVYIADTPRNVVRKLAPDGTLTTIAGGGSETGDGGRATAQLLQMPTDITVDPSGNLYIVESGAYRVRKVAPDLTISTVAGNGTTQSSGDGSAATSAGLASPEGIARDGAGNIYITEAAGNRVRKVFPLGDITTIAGNGIAGSGGDGGPAVAASLNNPSGVAVDSAGNVYIADRANNRIRKVSPDGVISSVAGTGAAGFGGDGQPATLALLDHPTSVSVDAAGSLFIADTLNNRVREVDANGIIATIAGNGAQGIAGDGGAPTDAQLNQPYEALPNASGTVLISQKASGGLRRMAPPDAPPPTTTTTSTTSTTSTTTTEPTTTTTSTEPVPTTTTSLAPTTTTDPSSPSTTAPVATTTPPTTVTTRPGVGTTTTGAPGNPGASATTASSERIGYWLLDAAGQVFNYGEAAPMGNVSGLRSGVQATRMAATPDGGGYWIVDSAGGVRPFGNAAEYGSLPVSVLHASEQVVALSPTTSGRGYWLFTSEGRVFPFGNAPSLGDMSGTPLNAAVLDAVATTTGRGYYMVGADGGIFAFGDAVFHGSMGGRPLNRPVQSLVPTASSGGYWLVASDGGIFAFGDAPFLGSMGGRPLNKPVVGMVRFGVGYLMVASDGGLFNFSDRPFLGSLGGNPTTSPVVAVSALPTR